MINLRRSLFFSSIILFFNIVNICFNKNSVISSDLLEAEIANSKFKDVSDKKKLIRQLKSGGYIVYFRHAETVKDYADQSDPNLNLRDCSTQRKLSLKGIQDARNIGKAFSNNNIPIGKVITSEYCRSWKTANYAFGRVDFKDSRLNFLPYEDYTTDLIKLMKKNIIPLITKSPDKGKNTIIVGHDDLFEAATGIYPEPQGIAYIIKPENNNQGFRIISNVLPSEWAWF